MSLAKPPRFFWPLVSRRRAMREFTSLSRTYRDSLNAAEAAERAALRRKQEAEETLAGALREFVPRIDQYRDDRVDCHTFVYRVSRHVMRELRNYRDGRRVAEVMANDVAARLLTAPLELPY